MLGQGEIPAPALFFFVGPIQRMNTKTRITQTVNVSDSSIGRSGENFTIMMELLELEDRRDVLLKMLGEAQPGV
jgi:hypothetical protein